MTLLFLFAEWHGLAKLRLHTEKTLHIMDQTTTSFSDTLREFKEHTCSYFVTRELEKEVNARKRKAIKKEAKLMVDNASSKSRSKASIAALQQECTTNSHSHGSSTQKVCFRPYSKST
jgi:hypothetical protein